MDLAALCVLVPLASACLLAMLAALLPRRVGLFALPPAIAAAVLAALVLARAGDRIVLWFGGWHPVGGAAVGVGFAVDRLGGGLALFIAVLAVAAFALASVLIRVETLLFDALALVFVGAMIGFALTGDLFNLFVFLELMSVAAIVLVGYEVRRQAPLEGSLTFAITSSVGAILLLFGIALLYGRTGALNLAQIGRTLGEGRVDTLVAVAFTL